MWVAKISMATPVHVHLAIATEVTPASLFWAAGLFH